MIDLSINGGGGVKDFTPYQNYLPKGERERERERERVFWGIMKMNYHANKMFMLAQ